MSNSNRIYSTLVGKIHNIMLEHLPVRLQQVDRKDWRQFDQMKSWCFTQFGPPFISNAGNRGDCANLDCLWEANSNFGFFFKNRADAMLAKLSNEGWKEVVDKRRPITT